MMKKMLRGILAGALLVSLCACGSNTAATQQLPSVVPVALAAETDQTPFADVDPGAGYAQAVAWCYERGLMNGVEEGQFAPEGTLTRAMIATVLYRAAGSPLVIGKAPSYNDTEGGVWYSNAVIWATAQGYIIGYGDGNFGTNDPVSVEQLELILGRYVKNGAQWTGDPAKAVDATRAQVAVALMEALIKAENSERGKTLVAVFSCTGNTRRIAETIAGYTGADLYEITPEVPYTADDLNYSNSSCRANREQNVPGARPAIAGDVDNWDSYDLIYLGYPIWWGVPPKIMSTFMESHSFIGKTVVPFCTSGSSGYNDSDIKKLMGLDCTWYTGQRFPGSASAAEIQSWVDKLGLSTKEAAPVKQLTVSFNGHTYTATLADNPSASAFAAHLQEQGGSVTISAHDYGSFEKVGPLDAQLVQTNTQIDTVPGDIILYQGSNVCLYYATNAWNFTRLGKLEGDLSSLKSDLGSGDVAITYTLAG